MTNKYLVQRNKRNALIRVNTFLMNEFCLPLSIPKILFKGFKRLIKTYNNKKVNSRYNCHKPVYNYLEIPENCFKSNTSRSMMRI